MQNLERKLALAKAKYGRAFVHEVRVKRVTRPSPLLRELNRISRQTSNPEGSEGNVSQGAGNPQEQSAAND